MTQYLYIKTIALGILFIFFSCANAPSAILGMIISVLGFWVVIKQLNDEPLDNQLSFFLAEALILLGFAVIAYSWVFTVVVFAFLAYDFYEARIDLAAFQLDRLRLFFQRVFTFDQLTQEDFQHLWLRKKEHLILFAVIILITILL